MLRHMALARKPYGFAPVGSRHVLNWRPLGAIKNATRLKKGSEGKDLYFGALYQELVLVSGGAYNCAAVFRDTPSWSQPTKILCAKVSGMRIKPLPKTVGTTTDRPSKACAITRILVMCNRNLRLDRAEMLVCGVAFLTAT